MTTAQAPEEERIKTDEHGPKIAHRMCNQCYDYDNLPEDAVFLCGTKRMRKGPFLNDGAQGHPKCVVCADLKQCVKGHFIGHLP